MKGCILPFPKKGDLGLAKNYRGITLTSIAVKIYNALVRNCIEPKIDNILRKNQNGFRRNRSTTSQILTIRRILEGVWAKTYMQHYYLSTRWYQVAFFESLVWLNLGLNPSLPDQWRTLYWLKTKQSLLYNITEEQIIKKVKLIIIWIL